MVVAVYPVTTPSIMSQNTNHSLVSTPPAASSNGWATYYTNTSGILRFVHPNGTDYVASTFYPATGAKTLAGLSNVATGNIAFSAGINAVVYGSSGNSLNSAPTVLGEPSFWIPVIGPNGQLLSMPAYTRSA